jgi:ankyrin repeat protein
MMIDALAADDVDVVIALLRRGVSAKTTPDGPHLLAVAGSAAAVQALLAAGADPNAIEAGGETALYRAGEKSVEVVAALLKAGARVEIDAAPPLHSAACAGNIGAVRLLLDGGANPARKFRDKTARECAQEIYEVMKQFPQLWDPPFEEDFAGVIALLEAAPAKAKPQQN